MSKFYTNVAQKGESILLRGYENGKRVFRKIAYKPTLFVLSPQSSEWKTMHGESVSPIEFESISEAKNFLATYSDVSNYPIFGLDRFAYTFLNEEYIGSIDYDPSLINVANIDIETARENAYGVVETALEEITAITVKTHGKFHVFGCGVFVSNSSNIIYHRFKSEREMLLGFLAFWENDYPDVVTGWNIDFYDIPYLVQRITNLFGEKVAKRLSPWRTFTTRSVTIMGRENITTSLLGISSLDYMQLFKKFSFNPQESYSLDNVAYSILKKRKISYDEVSSLQELYKTNYQKFIEYNIEDVKLVDEIDDHMKLLELVYAMSYYAKVNYNDTFAQVRMWDVLIHNYLWNKKIVIPHKGTGIKKEEAYVGAYVKDPVPGMYNWVVSFDFTSMYPMLIIQNNISPEMISGQNMKLDLDKLIDGSFSDKVPEGYCVAANGELFRTHTKGFLAELMEIGYNSRSEYKKLMLDAQRKYESATSPIIKEQQKKLTSRYKNLQMAMKINLNSAYGAIGNEFFRYFDVRQATAITIGGRLYIKAIEHDVNKYMNKLLGTQDVDYVIAVDTDSVYINFDSMVSKFYTGDPNDKMAICNLIDRMCEKFTQKIESSCERLSISMNCPKNAMSMKREVIADRGIWTAKKRYILSVLDSEKVRYNEPEIKIMGMEAIKSSTPRICRDAIKKCIKIMMTGTETELQNFIQDFKKEFMSLPFEDIAAPRGVSELSKFTINSKALPIHVRACLVYNEQLDVHNLSKKYQKIQDGDKIKFAFLKLPNPSKSKVIASIRELPSKFGLDKFIDYELQFKKVFLDPIESITNVIGWNPIYKNTLEDLFS